MAFATEHLIILLVSIVLGGVTGEVIGIEKYLNRFAAYLEKSLKGGSGQSGLAKGFVTATLIYCVGAMAIMGSLQSGLTGEHSILYAKSFIDGVTSVVLSSTLGIGVALSALPLFLYQGSITLLAGWIEPYIIEEAITEMKAAGGLLILAIGLNMLEIIRIRVGNLLPAVLYAVVFMTIMANINLKF